jgi:hypothetical protein
MFHEVCKGVDSAVAVGVVVNTSTSWIVLNKPAVSKSDFEMNFNLTSS